MSRTSKLSGLFTFFSLFFSASAFAQAAQPQSPTAWNLLVSGGPVVVLMLITSVAAGASIIYHFQNVKPEKLTPREFTENLIFLLEKKEYQKAVSVCKQQENMISAIALKGLSKVSQGKAVVESAVQYEGKARIEKMWQNLNYLGDIAVVAPMLGLLGTTLGMIDAFNFFKAGTLHPGMLTGGLAKAMINTALGLVIAVPCLVFYSYFRGRVSQITSNAETAAAEIMHTIAK
jgi:biopolymer transport protein ExbB